MVNKTSERKLRLRKAYLDTRASIRVLAIRLIREYAKFYSSADKINDCDKPLLRRDCYSDWSLEAVYAQYRGMMDLELIYSLQRRLVSQCHLRVISTVNLQALKETIMLYSRFSCFSISLTECRQLPVISCEEKTLFVKDAAADYININDGDRVLILCCSYS